MRMHSISCTKLNLDLFSLLRQHELKKINLPAKDSQSGVACNDQSYNVASPYIWIVRLQCTCPVLMYLLYLTNIDIQYTMKIFTTYNRFRFLRLIANSDHYISNGRDVALIP